MDWTNAIKEIEEYNKPIYRIFKNYDEDNFSVVIEIYGVDYERYLTNADNIAYAFSSEEKAKEWLNNNIKPEYVHDDSKIVNNKFNREKYFINYEEEN